jgi:hypothetical protein
MRPTISRMGLLSLLAFAIPALGCGSSGGDSSRPAGAAGPGNESGPSGSPAPCGVATLPAGYLVDNLGAAFSADTYGVAFGALPPTTDGESPWIVGDSTYAGALKILYALPGGSLLNQLTSDADNVYFSFGGFDTTPAPGLYAVPHGAAGATPTPIFVPTDGRDIDAFTQDADNLYVTVTDVDAPGAIYSVSKATKAATLLYTAPGQLTIDNLFVDGSTVYWTEGELFGKVDTIIQSSPLAATLTPTTFATVAQPLSVSSLIEAGGTVAFGYFALVGNSDAGFTFVNGIYTIVQGGKPVLADSSGLFPLIMGPGADAYYMSYAGISKITLNQSGASSPTRVVPGETGLGLAVAPTGTLYYATATCIDKK